MLLGGVGCTPGHGGWSVEALRQEHPEIELHRGHRLGDAAPYFVPIDGGLFMQGEFSDMAVLFTAVDGSCKGIENGVTSF